MTAPPPVPEPASTPGPDSPFVRFDGRILDPATAVRLPGVPIPSITAYVGDTVLVSGGSEDRVQEAMRVLGERAADLGLRIAADPLADGGPRLYRDAVTAGLPLVVPVVLVPTDATGPTAPVDVWPLVQAIRADGTLPPGTVELDHLMFAAASISGNPFGVRGLASISGDPFGVRGLASVNGNPFGVRGLAGGDPSYAYAGSGGRGPVSVLIDPPVPPADGPRPRVVVLDTGVGRHPWFTADPVSDALSTPSGDPIGVDPKDPVAIATAPDGAGAAPDPMTGRLASHAGHGTFICGLLRQTCPAADIVALRIMDSDGVVPEHRLTDALTGLGLVQAAAPRSIAAVVLALGYHAEVGDGPYTAGLESQLQDLAGRGVVTVAAAGNDATTQPSYPAAFSVHDWPAGLPRVVAVAALNPDTSVALFSNDGDWVTGQAPGANVVSTAPTDAEGSAGESVGMVDEDGRRRGTIDPDDYSSGFATWSGTSFAAPVLAGRYLAALAARTAQKNSPPVVSDLAALVPLGRTAGQQGPR
ncbi:S8 family serine peptidase [Nakamurella sp. YIM 132087]|uniref:S8 family serine peptidase n=1 Tax=Nakamurella alba TaxID=2665158 RepID=A0A7K1FRM8_9ACTN|nr:S8 family serine peptidase [Nakamurella alba]MTD16795.1 S8 family serine peptidase [Nakamurella alba]